MANTRPRSLSAPRRRGHNLTLADAGVRTPGGWWFGGDIFLKIDIEGWEYRVLDELAQNADRFSGMAIEFHDTDLHGERIDAFIDAISGEHALIHFHPNNYAATDQDGNSIVFELTFAP